VLQAIDARIGTGADYAGILVADRTAPVLTVNPAAAVYECALSTYAEAGASVSDVCDPAITVIVGGDVVDTFEVGSYTVTYDATDDSGNAAVQKTRAVGVLDTTAPTGLVPPPRIALFTNAGVTMDILDPNGQRSASDACGSAISWRTVPATRRSDILLGRQRRWTSRGWYRRRSQHTPAGVGGRLRLICRLPRRQLMRFAKWQPVLLLSLYACNGGEDPPDRTVTAVTDSTGTQFMQSCDSYWCDLSLVRSDGCGDDAELLGARFLVACTGADEIIYTQNCRPLACTEDDDCAQFSDLAYTCRNGVCEDASWSEDFAVSRDELYALCLREVSRDEFCKRSPQVEPEDPFDVPVTELVTERCGVHECETIPDECVP
jgi:hypothetical protein